MKILFSLEIISFRSSYQFIYYVYKDIMDPCYMTAHPSLSILVKLIQNKLTKEKLRADIRCVVYEILTAVVTKNKPSICSHAGILLSLRLDPEDGGDMFLRNVS
jgi:hypothetical protein